MHPNIMVNCFCLLMNQAVGYIVVLLIYMPLPYIRDLWEGACGRGDLRWFGRTLIFEVATLVSVVAVILTPRLRKCGEFPMALGVFSAIASWEYLK